MDPSQNQPYQFLPPVVQDQQQPSTELAAEATLPAPETPPSPALNPTEVIPPAPAVPQYPIGLIDFNQPIVVVDGNYSEETFDNASVITVLKGSVHPVVVSFWKHGEQSIAQFDTDGDSACGDYKIEQDQPYPRTIYVVIGRDGRNLVVDEDVYASEEAAHSETNVDEVAGVFPLVIEAPKATEVPVAVSDFHEGGVETEEQDEDLEGTEVTSTVNDPNQPPTEMYVAGRTRRVGETVTFYRNGFGTRTGTIRKMRRDSRQSLFVEPTDGSGPYWALNKNVRY
jgi:hypothetical protein